MKAKAFYCVMIFLMLFTWGSWARGAERSWKLKLTHETPVLTQDEFVFMVAADLNRNGSKEIVLTDFGRFVNEDTIDLSEREKKKDPFNLLIFEWDGKSLKRLWSKQWDPSTIHGTDEEHLRYFSGWAAYQMVVWSVGDRVFVETIPPYLGLEWANGEYRLQQQPRYAREIQQVGSWALPWLSASCHPDFVNRTTWPRECLVGIRDFSGKGQPKVVTAFERDDLFKNQNAKEILRVRKFEPGFPVEWEQEIPFEFGFGWGDPIDPLNWKATSGLLIYEHGGGFRSLFGSSETGQGYRLRPTGLRQTDKQVKYPWDKDPIRLIQRYSGTGSFNVPQIGKTQSKSVEEYWGYRRVDIPDPKANNFIYQLRKVTIKPDLSGVTEQDINFKSHDRFLGIGFFDIEDLDGDGLDEVILVEETGKMTFVGQETVEYSEVKDYIRILKWNGKEYQTMWVSPPFTRRGTKFLVEDMKNTGKKQLVVGTGNGTVQIWEKQ